METVQRNAAAGARPAQDQARLRPDHPLARPGGDRRGARPGQRAAADRVLRHLAPPGRRRGGLHGRLRGRPGAQERVPPLPDQGFDGQDDVRSMHEVITRRFRRYLAEKERTGEWADGGSRRASRRRARPGRERLDPDEDGPAQALRLPAAARRRRRRPAAGRRPPSGPWTSWASTTSPSAASPSAWRRSGCPARTTRWCCPAPARASTCSSGSVTRPTASRSPTSAAKRAKRLRPSPLDDVPGLGETRKQALIKHFGSVKRLRSATIDQICEVPGHRPQDGGDRRRGPRPGGSGRARREHGDRRDH